MKTNDMIVILGGAYTDVYKNLIEKNGLGFGADVKSEKEKKPRKATPSDFIQKSQMTDEFMGRVAIVHLNDLSVDDKQLIYNKYNPVLSYDDYLVRKHRKSDRERLLSLIEYSNE